ncbi:MAG: hypothetical protein DRO52_00340 [Candidatus Hecatellales archaeon]|nr:MAG: hypothetical protein DRO52_00340 [Candidatus Hecatellales archaeon]
MAERLPLKLGVALAVGLILFILLLSYVGFERVSSIMVRASPPWLAASAAILIPFYLLRAYRWKLILMPVRNPTRLSSLFWITGVGYMVNTLIPVRVGELARAILVDRSEKTGFTAGLSSIAIERLLDLVALASLGALTLSLTPFTSTPQVVIGSLKAVVLLIIALIALIFLAVRFKSGILSLLGRLPLKASWRQRIAGFIESLIEAAGSMVAKPRLLASSLLLSWLLWTVFYGSYYFLFKAFNYEASALLIFTGYIFMMITFILPAAPGYVGSFEAFWMLIFLALGLKGSETLLAMALTYHLISITAMIGLGALAASILGISIAETLRGKGAEFQR